MIDTNKSEASGPIRQPHKRADNEKIDPEEFKKKVEEVAKADEQQKKRKRNLTKSEEEGEENVVQEQQAPSAQTSFEDVMKGEKNKDGVFDVQEPGSKQTKTTQKRDFASPFDIPKDAKLPEEENVPVNIDMNDVSEGDVSQETEDVISGEYSSENHQQMPHVDENQNKQEPQKTQSKEPQKTQNKAPEKKEHKDQSLGAHKAKKKKPDELSPFKKTTEGGGSS